MQHDPNYSRGSIHNQLVHMYIVEWMWYRCCIHDVPKTREGWPNRDDLQTREQIRAAWSELESLVREFVTTATDEQLSRYVFQPLMDPPLQVYDLGSLINIVILIRGSSVTNPATDLPAGRQNRYARFHSLCVGDGRSAKLGRQVCQAPPRCEQRHGRC